MRPVIYVDTLFLTNFITDFFLLHITQSIYKKPSPVWRIVCGSCVASIYSVLMFFPELSLFYSMTFKLVISGAIIFIAFPIKSVRDFFSLSALFFLSSFAFAGILLALFYFTDIAKTFGVVMSNGVFFIDINPLYLIGGAILCYALIHMGERLYTKCACRGANIHTIRLGYGDKIINIRALLDTANAVSDPITNTPVIVCSLCSLRTLFKDEQFYDKLCMAQEINSDKLKVELVCDTPFRLVPYRALGCEGDVMLAFAPSILEIDKKKYGRSVLIGICDKKLSPTGHYEALLHPQIMISI